MKKLILLLTICLPAWTAVLTGQTEPNRAFQSITVPGSTAEWLKVRDNVQLTAGDFFTKAKTALNLTEHDELRLMKTTTDELGMTHSRYQQYAHGIKVYGAEYVLHEQDFRVKTANGKLVTGIEAPAAGTMTENAARSYAIEAVPSYDFLWLNERAEEYLREITGNPDTTFFPKGNLVWERMNRKAGFAKNNLLLAWVFDIFTGDGRSAKVFVDAYSGDLLRKIPLDINCDPGTGTTTWNGTVNMNTDQVGMSYILLDDCQSPNIHVYNANDSSSISFAAEYVDGDNAWTDMSAVQTFFGLRQAWQYYLTQHGRDSYNNAGADINGYNQAGFINSNGNLYWSNASWSPGQQVWRFGDNNSGIAGDDWNTVDIVGHEFTHAVTTFSANLNYLGESGALNESFSDIFGEMVELYTEGSMDWLVGAERGAIRSLANPGNFNDPDTYLGTNWFDTSIDTIDNGGVHTNSGVQNHWFYLLSVGGTDTDDNGEPYEVQGIGAASAALIAYRNLTVYLGAVSDYNDAKNGAIQAAADLFGTCSNEVLQCARAWNAVGVYATDDIGYDIVVDCVDLATTHAALLPYNVVAFNDVRSDCGILPNGTLVDFQAGHTVLLKPGFRSGDNFRAHIVSCGPISSPLTGRSMGNDWQGTHPLPENTWTEGLETNVYPNPFSSRLNLRFELNEPSNVSVYLTDAKGTRIQTPLNNVFEDTGEHTCEFETGHLNAGIYFLEIVTGKDRQIRKVVKLK
ncbi:MAG: M4 family metallopeptidase [Saprospiraceae bacterium]